MTHQPLLLTCVVAGLLMTGLTAPPDEDTGENVRPPKPPRLPMDASSPPLRIAFVSYANPQQVATDSETICRYLEPYLGIPVKGSVTVDYGSSIEAMRYEQADLAFVDPLAFMMAHEQIGARPLLLEVYTTGTPTYYSCVWVREDSGIKTLEDLRGKTIAFADQVDMSGHLLPRDIFVRAGLLNNDELGGKFFKQVYFAGGDEQAVRAVLNGFVDAAGVSQFSYLLLRPQERDQVTVIDRSVESPSHLIMARPGLPDDVIARFKQALLALDPADPQDKVVLDKLYGVRGYAEAKFSDFDEVARIAARYGFVKKPAAFADDAAIPDQ
jgi:phosphonate transport system substrate-binding protein